MLLIVAASGAVTIAVTAPAPARAASAGIAALQVGLRAEGFTPGAVDGVTGPRTAAALRRFQRREGISVDGVSGPETRRALGRRGQPSLGARTMQQGQSGWDVAALQFLLRERGFGAGGFDGGFGEATAAAVSRFQSAAGLTSDGVVGPQTFAAMRGRELSSEPIGPVRFMRPLGGEITDGFGMVGRRMHTGIDIPAASGRAVGAAGRGTVSFAGYSRGGYGNLVVIDHRLGFETWYAHLSRVATSAGEAVAGGSVIGYVGSTGRSTGPHLHFEVRLFGTPVNPEPRLLSAVSASKGAGGIRPPSARPPAATPRRCRPNADAHGTRDSDPRTARFGRCP